MSKVAIIGAGRVGTAAAKILLAITDHEVVLVDSNEEALTKAFTSCSDVPRAPYRVALSPTLPLETYVAYGVDQLEATLRSVDPDVVVCATPFTMNVAIAGIANKIGSHYVDFTEDNAVTNAIADMGISRRTFVPQTGLAPGLVNYLGLSLFGELDEPLALYLRVGALPQVSFGPGHYAITWSPEGLINEYIKPAYRKAGGELEEVPPLDDHETMIVNGVQYEAFTTAGGVGMLGAYENIPNVEYKTLRFPGHLEFMQKLLARVNNEFEDAVALARQTFVTTRDDTVVLAAFAVDATGHSASTGLHFFPCEELGLTALELTTAGVGVGVVELILAGELEAGVLNAAQIPFDKLMATNSLKLVFEYAD
jgi:saccharopine dehydrogenase-like NADP-dependent oxidoreductase